MRITFSKKGDSRGRHVVLIAEYEETYDVMTVVTREVLPPGIRPEVEKFADTARTHFLFRIDTYLDRLLLCFPDAELSDGVVEYLGRAEKKRLDSLPVAPYKYKGFRGKFWGRFQAQGAYAIAEHHIDFLTDEMGLGKTYQVLAAICRLRHVAAKLAKKEGRKPQPYRVVVAVPNNVKYTWAEAICDNFDLTYAIIDAKEQSFAERQRVIESDVEVLIVNVEGIRAKPVHVDNNIHKPIIAWNFTNPALFVNDCNGRTEFTIEELAEEGIRREFDFFVLDECHRVKTPNAQVTNGFFQLQCKRLLAMSGTPVLNRPQEIWTVLHKLYPESFKSYERFCDVLLVKNDEGRRIGYQPDAMAELRGFLQTVTLRRRKDQVRDDLPEVVDLVYTVELSDEQRRLYNTIKNEFLLELEDGTTKEIMGVLPQITRLKQAAFSPELYEGSTKSAKIEKLKEIVEQLVASGEKAIIFSQWTKATRIIRRELAKYNPAYVTGEVTSLRARHEEQARFRTDPDCKLYIGTIAANREGVNLGNATYVIFTDLDWVPAGKDQAVGRSAAGGLRGVHLAGKDLKVHVIEIQAEDTCEEWIQDLLQGKRNLVNRMNERDAGRQVRKIEVSDIARLLRSEGKPKAKAA